MRRADLVAFMRRQGMPLGDLARVVERRVLLVACEPAVRDALVAALPDHTVETASGSFSAGVLFEGLHPDVVVIDADGLGRVEATILARHCFERTVTVVLGEDVTPRHRRLPKPVDTAALVEAVAAFASLRKASA